MRRFLVHRLLLAVPTLVGVSLVVFLTTKLVPGDPVASLLGPLAPPDARRELVERLGLDQPLPIQFGQWSWNVAQGRLGTSIQQQRPVLEIVRTAFGNTAILALAGAVLAFAGGLLIGATGAFTTRRLPRGLASGMSFLAMSVPQYSIALGLVALLAVRYQVLPAGGMYDPVDGGGAGDLLRHLVLPAVAVSLIPMGVVGRMLRASLVDVMSGDQVEAMRARGLGRAAIARHALHNALPSLLTITGLQLAYLIGGVVFVETIFSWPGLGQALYNAIASRDLPLVQGGVLVIAIAFVLINIVVDGVHALIDPRVRR
ncbi:ABC transporter permease [Actinomadura citrea]|jgi:peptide/nickel transport system permease protein|uniref:Peptide/nickel transport system permease protein n=1 Tax=Actinomadura citrea TaxID=46158 RepID=A0A7Y9GDW1_9ACTN|nr:ABC transporter permease [Actinomadura citrea]NYE14686.1 peptide/nickel transport system permease protein [Actinomadura citrea]GGT83619.1 glutathione ABC transporter permease [Actinomadura citrea]